jgi:polyhydroxybutyrate depolymerase
VKGIAGYAATTFISLGLVLLAAYAYFLYSPLPAAPHLSGHATPLTMPMGPRVRRYIEYVPTDLPKGAPLIIVLHGRLMTGEMMREMTAYEFDQAADRNHFAVVYPDAYERTWYDCRKDHLAKAAREHIDDFGFVRALIAAEQVQRGIDPRKVFAVGFSNGGHMAMDLAARHPATIAGAAVFSASMPLRAETTCPLTGSTPPVMIVDGTSDPINPFQGGEVNLFGLQKVGDAMSATATAEAFARRDGIRAPEVTTDLPHRHADDPTRVERMTWSREGKPYIVLYEVVGGGHVVPQPEYRFPRLFGRTSGDIDGPAEAVAFFLHR